MIGTAMADEPIALADHQWKHRILVVPEASDSILANLKHHEIDMTDRDLIVFKLAKAGDSPLGREISERFQIAPESEFVLLIGKDGRTQVRWQKEDFSYEILFRRIDSMPMRQREMRQR